MEIKRKITILLIAIIALGFFQQANAAFGINEASPRSIELFLKRYSLPLWSQKKQAPVNAVCQLPDQDSDLQHFDQKINFINTKCKSPITIEQECVFKNIAYTTPLILGENKFDKPFNFSIDISTPWSWIQSPACNTCERNGEKCEPDACPSMNNNFSQTYSCDGCQQTQKCGNINYFAEGLSLAGTFVNTQMNFPNVRPTLGKHQFLWVDQASGIDFFQFDGSIGLGIDHTDDIDVTEDGKDNPEGSSTRDTDYEPETSFLDSLINGYSNIQFKIFSLYLAEDRRFPPKILIGLWEDHLIHDFDQNKPRWWNVTNTLSASGKSEYFKWQVPMISILVQRSDQDTKTLLEAKQEAKYSDFPDASTKGLLSISTSALVLPEQIILSIVTFIENTYQHECTIKSYYMDFLVCTGMSKLELKGIQVSIKVGTAEDPIILYVNPDYLIQGCKENEKDQTKYDCILNIQKSYNKGTILGEAALKNSYLIFDIENRQIGFAPARSQYNELSLIQEISLLIREAEDVLKADIEFLMRFFFVITAISLVLILYLYGKKCLRSLSLQVKYRRTVNAAELAHLDLNKHDTQIQYTSTAHIVHSGGDDSNIRQQIEDIQIDSEAPPIVQGL